MKNIWKIIVIITIILFLSLYFSKYNMEYYENKKVLTDNAIEKFEEDLKEGKEINAENYIVEEKNYNNKISKLGIEASEFIEKSFNKGLNCFMKYLIELENN